MLFTHVLPQWRIIIIRKILGYNMCRQNDQSETTSSSSFPSSPSLIFSITETIWCVVNVSPFLSVNSYYPHSKLDSTFFL